MKIRITRKAMTENLFKLQGVVGQRSTLTILSNALLEAADGTLTLSATDLDTSMSTSCACEVLEPGRVTLHAKGLFDIVKNLQEDTLELETEENYWAQLRSGSVSCRIVGTHPDDFPQMLDTSSATLHPIGAELLLDMIDKTLFSVSTQDARPNLTGAFFRINPKGAFLMVSTDGHRLSRIEPITETTIAAGKIPQELRQGIIIPRKGLAELKRTIDAKSEDLSFGFVNNSIIFKHGRMSLTIRLIDGTFPDFTQVIPKEGANKALVQRDALIQALRFVSLFANPKTHNVRFSISPNGLEVYASDPDRGEGKKIVPVDYSGNPAQAAYNFRYMLDVLNVIDGDEVLLEMLDPLSPTLIRDASRDEMLFVVMPMRV